MSTFLIIVNLAVMVLLLLGFYYLQRKHVSFTKRVFAALGVGIVFGLVLQAIYGPTSDIIQHSANWMDIVGQGFVNLLLMTVMPLIFISILAAFTKTQLSTNIGKIGSSVVVVLIGTAAIAAVAGIAASLLLHVDAPNLAQGHEETSQLAHLNESMGSIEDMSTPEKILALFPTNPFDDLTRSRQTSTIATVIFASILGIAYIGVRRKQPEHGERFKKAVETLHAIVMRVVTLILRLTPFGILALMTKVAATSEIGEIMKLGKFVIALYIALFVMFLIHLLLIALSGLNPLTYVKKVMPVLTFAFTSRSSAGTLPLNVNAQHRRLGVPEGIANFAGSFSLTMGQNGCAAIYPAMLAMMVAPTVGIDPSSPAFILQLIAVVALSSLGVAGVGGGATFAALIVLSTMNLPIAMVALLISIEPLIDMGRTALNVSDGMLSGLLTGRFLKQLDTKVYTSKGEQSSIVDSQDTMDL